MTGNKEVNSYLPPSLPSMASTSLSRSNQPSPPSLRHILNDAPSISWNESGSKINCASVREKVGLLCAYTVTLYLVMSISCVSCVLRMYVLYESIFRIYDP